MKQHQTSKESFARSLIGLSIGTMVLLVGVIVLFQNFYISPAPNPSAATNTPNNTVDASPNVVTATQPPATNSIVPPVLLSLADKQVISANDSITLPAPAKPRATMVSEVEPINATSTSVPPTPVQKTMPPPEKIVAKVDDTTSSKTPVQTTSKPNNKSNETTDDKTKKDKVALTSTQTTTGKTGWIYAGQFSEGKWQAKGLIIGDELPATGHSYALNWGANIRANPPGKTKVEGLRENVGYLAQGRKVEILQIKQSGSKGHIWVQIKR